jgi:hypothetical protein
MAEARKSLVHFLIWLPLPLYGLAVASCLASVKRGAEPVYALENLEPLGSFIVFFYAFYLALWRVRWTAAKRMVAALALAPMPIVPLALLDLAGVQLQHAHDPHVLLFNVGLWLEPGMIISHPLLSTMERLRPPEPFDPGKVYVRGAVQQADGSLIVYGGVGSDRSWTDSFGVFARLDAAGNVDTGFQPPALPSPGMGADFAQPDGTILFCYDDDATKLPVVVRLSPDGSWTEVFRVVGWEGLTGDNPQLKFNLESPGAAVQLLPRCAVPRLGLTRLLPDHRPDAAFNEQAAKSLDAQDLGSYRMATFDRQGRLVVVFQDRLLRVDSKGRLLPPGAIAFDKIKGDTPGNSTMLAVHSNGSIFVAQGEEEAQVDWPLAAPLHRLMRFDKDLREDRNFTRAASDLANGVGRFYVLGMRGDGGVIVSLVQKKRGSRILYLGLQGQLVREVHLDRIAGLGK